MASLLYLKVPCFCETDREELGINLDEIKRRTLIVLNPSKEVDAAVLEDPDLAGPLIFCLLLGFVLLLVFVTCAEFLS
jgi:hypothetical protein